jgi:sec-independent protein translocase protein TatB
VLGINAPELLIIAIVAVLVIGPARLPEYAEKLRNLIRELRRMASGARDTIKEEAGVDLDDIDWKKLDPRQYDPRRIIRDALMDDDVPASPTRPIGTAAPAAVAAITGAAAETAAHRPVQRLAPGQAAPFDVEAT